jgi:lipoyl(octanoyl) transferase
VPDPLALVVRRLGRREYLPVLQAMQRFTDGRGPDTTDEIWLTEHPPVYTLGLNGKPEHVLDPGDVPVVQCDRGGQVTYHGPGQLVVYTLLALRRRALGVRQMVSALELAVIDLLQDFGIEAHARPHAPGVYVGQAKVAALGLRVRRDCCYHGLSLNVDMDLEPFRRINPCGYPGLAVTQLRELGAPTDPDAVADGLVKRLAAALGASAWETVDGQDPPDSVSAYITTRPDAG